MISERCPGTFGVNCLTVFSVAELRIMILFMIVTLDIYWYSAELKPVSKKSVREMGPMGKRLETWPATTIKCLMII